jgi:RNA polymerase sigma-70 factor (ECF subfamily)
LARSTATSGGQLEQHGAADQAMSRYASGDDAAFGAVYDALAPLLRRYLGRRVRDQALVEDLMQQTFLKLHLHRGSFVPGARVAPWACSIAIRLLIDRARRDKLGRALFSDEESAESQSSSASPEEAVLAREVAEHFETALAALPAGHRRAFDLVKRDGLSIAEAAAELDATPTSIKLRLFRTYERLRGALSGQKVDRS